MTRQTVLRAVREACKSAPGPQGFKDHARADTRGIGCALRVLHRQTTEAQLPSGIVLLLDRLAAAERPRNG